MGEGRFRLCAEGMAWDLYLAAWEALVWVAGFPCTPFSALHAGSTLLAEAEARQFYESVRRFKCLKAPAPRHVKLKGLPKRLTQLGLLENVIGLHKVKTQIMDHIKAELPEPIACTLVSNLAQPASRYEILWLTIDPSLGTCERGFTRGTTMDLRSVALGSTYYWPGANSC